MTDITIPDSVTSIETDAFFICEALTDVYYGGTEEEWNAIEIDDPNTELLNAIIHFSSAESILPGDVDGDGVLDITDATFVLVYYAKQAAGISTDDFTAAQIQAADANGDGIIDISDATKVLTIYAENAAGI